MVISSDMEKRLPIRRSDCGATRRYSMDMGVLIDVPNRRRCDCVKTTINRAATVDTIEQ